MKILFYNYLAMTMFLMLSCQKNDLLPNPTEDYSNQLVGTYTGTFEMEQILSPTNEEEIEKVKDVLPQQSINISKAIDKLNGLLINGNSMNILAQSVENKNQYGDVFIYTAQDCSGTESYLLKFYPNENRLVLEYTHKQDCTTGKLEQNSVFTGWKLN